MLTFLFAGGPFSITIDYMYELVSHSPTFNMSLYAPGRYLVEGHNDTLSWSEWKYIDVPSKASFGHAYCTHRNESLDVVAAHYEWTCVVEIVLGTDVNMDFIVTQYDYQGKGSVVKSIHVCCIGK